MQPISELPNELVRAAIELEADEIIRIHLTNLGHEESIIDMMRELAHHLATMNIFVGSNNQHAQFTEWLKSVYPEKEFKEVAININIPEAENLLKKGNRR